MRELIMINDSNRVKWIHVRLTPEEQKLLYVKFRTTTCRNLSQFLRSILLDNPVVTKYRNASLDSMLEAMAQLNIELNAIGNNLNQTVKRLHTLRDSETASWTARYTAESESVLAKIFEVKALLTEITKQWLR